MAFLGIDLGGTGIKAAVVDEQCNIVASAYGPTHPERGAQDVTDRIAQTALAAVEKAGMTLADITRGGIGTPGAANPRTGVVQYSNNLGWRGYPLRDELSRCLGGLRTYLGNDASVAAYGEYCAGSARGAQSAAVITLGTGVGSGVIMDGRILTGFAAGGAEFGHMVIQEGGRLCTCGARGCWEAYCSATGLTGMIREAMAAHPDSLMWEVSERDGEVTAKTVFDARELGDEAAGAVFDEFIRYLACGVANVINCLQPEVVSLGGGVSKQGENLLAPLRQELAHRIYGGPSELVTQLRVCTLGNDAGMIGAAMLTQ